MGLLDEFGAWLDQKKRNVAANAQNLPGLLASFAQDVQQGAAADKSAWDASRSVMPGVREAGIREMNARGQELGGLLGAIKAYHGSPHKFDRFDLSKIGTGEGAQAYGHGIYMAESPGVAGSYRDKLSKNEVLLDGKKVKHNRSDTSPQSMGLNALQMEPTPAAASAALRNAAADDTLWQRGSQYYDLRNNYLAAADWLDANAKRLQVDSGSLYEASIRWPDAAREAADPLGPQHFLDWDKPLSEQPEKVKQALRKSPIAPDESVWQHYTGQQLYEGERNAVGPYNADGWPTAAASLPVSESLRSAGIPGIRYLDGGSRGAGQGAHNYVVFDDKLLEILKRNGEPVPQQGLLAREPTKFQLAHAEAQRNAALPIEQGGLGLGPNNTAMERAKAMGFTTPGYHGTGKDFEAFADDAWTSASPMLANRYAKIKGPDDGGVPSVMPLLVNKGKTLKIGGDANWKVTWPEARQMTGLDFKSASPYADEAVDGILQKDLLWRIVGDEGFKSAAREAGKDSVAINEQGLKTLLSLDPSNVRSRFAAFDPKRRDSRDLLASMGLLGLLGAGAYGQDSP